MNAVLGTLGLLAETGLDDEQRRYVETARDSAEHLLAIINDILDLSKIEAGRLALETTDFALPPLLAGAVDLFRPSAQARGATIALAIGPSVPEHLRGDAGRVRQILLNLVSNAIKFSPGGCVRLQVTHHASPRPRLRFEVSDTGIGMTEHQPAALFCDFSQADHSIARRFGGTGLGLSISRKLARMLGGDIDVRSEPGRGSTFTVLVDAPLAPGATLGQPGEAEPSAAAGPAPATPATASELSGRTILLAEDNADNQRLLAFHLKPAGGAVMVVGIGRDAVQACLSARAAGTPFDLVLMDMQMPELDGFEATRKLRAAGVVTPIVALTAHALLEDRQRCIDAGCDEHAAKPIERARLIETCARLAREGRPPALIAG